MPDNQTPATGVNRANIPWARWEDCPILNNSRVDQLRIGMKVVCPTESGRHWTLVRYDEKSPYQRCNERRSIAETICFAQKGHEEADIPHLPMSEELDNRSGFKIVAIEYGSKPVAYGERDQVGGVKPDDL